jgi:large subunit ribosomal protein L10
MVHPSKVKKLNTLLNFIKEGDNNFALAGFDRTTHQKLEELREELRKTGSKMKIIKNSFLGKAVNRLSQEDASFKSLKKSTKDLKNQTIVVSLTENWADSLKAFDKFAKTEESLSFKFGFIENSLYEEKGLYALAKLPGKDELIGKLIGTMKNPMSKTVYSLKYNMQKLAYVLAERGKQAD